MDAAMTQDNNFAVDQHATDDQRTYATLTHLSGLISVMDGMGLISLPVAIIMWQVKKKESPWLDDHLKEAVNFQISMLIWSLIAGLIILITFGIGVIFMLPFLIILRLVGCIRAAVYATKGRYHRYPASWRIIA